MTIPANVRSLLVIKNRAMGDTLLATPSLRVLRQAWPQARITAMVSPSGREVLQGNPHVSDIVVYDKRSSWPEYFSFVGRLRSQHYDVAVNLHATFRTALLARLSGARIRTVNNHSGRDYFATNPITAQKEAKSTIQRDFDALRALGLDPRDESLVFPLTPADYAPADAFLQAAVFKRRRPVMVLASGSNAPERRWSVETAAEFLNLAGDWANWIILAGPAEAAMARAIHARAAGHPPVFSAGIKVVGALLARSQGVVTVNSGPKHVAVAVGAPTLTLWTDEPEAEWHPYDRQRHALLRPASGRLADIAPADVFHSAKEHFGKVWKRQ